MGHVLKMRTSPRFLSSIFPGTGTAVRKDGLATYVDLDLSQFGVLGSYDPAEQQIPVRSSQDGSINLLTVGQIISDSRADRTSILDFIPPNIHADIRAGNTTTDLSSYLADARDALAAANKPVALVWPSGKYTYSVSPNWAVSNCQLLPEGDVYLNYTGTGNCFIVDGGASPASGVINMNIGRFRIIGTGSAGHGAFFRAMHHSTVEGPIVHGCGTTSDGIRTEFCVLSQWNRPTVSNNEGAFGTAAPAVGLRVTQRSALNQTAYCTFINPIMEGLAVGARFDDSIGNTVLGGAFEGCSAQGLLMGTTAVYNKFYGMDYEANGQDIYCAGDHNSFIDCDTHTTIIFDATTNGNIVKGGVHKNITIQASAVNNCVEFARYNWDNSGATISDSGTNTRLFGNLNLGTSTWNTGPWTFDGLLTAGGGIVVTGGISINNADTLAWANGSSIYGAATTGAILSTFRLTGAGSTTALNFGGDTSSFPALVRNSTALKVRLADDSADAPLTAGTIASAAQTVTSSSANALAVGRQGSTSPAFNVDASTASSATGLNVKAAAAAGGLAVSVLSSGTNENLTIDAKGSGTITLGGTSTGSVVHTRATTLSAALTYGGVTLSNAVTGTGNMVLSAGPTFTGTTNFATISASGTVLGGGGIFTGDGASFGWGAGTASIVGNSSANVFVFYTASTERLRISNSYVATTVGIVSANPTGGIGYATGAGGAITQGTSRTTGVTLNTVSGDITLFSAAGSTSFNTFTVTNSAVAATDTIHVVQKSGTDKYQIFVTAVGSGSFAITFATTGGTTSEQPVFHFNVIKGVSS